MDWMKKIYCLYQDRYMYLSMYPSFDTTRRVGNESELPQFSFMNVPLHQGIVCHVLLDALSLS